jgi:hypothetical protein
MNKFPIILSYMIKDEEVLTEIIFDDKRLSEIQKLDKSDEFIIKRLKLK